MSNSKIKNTLQMTKLLFAMAMLFSYISWVLFDYQGFIIIGHIDIPYALEQAIRFGVLLANHSLFFCFILKFYSKKIFLLSLPVTCLELLRYLLLPNIPSLLATIIIPIIIVLFIGYKNKIFKSTVIWTIVVQGILLLHSFIVSRITQTDLCSNISLYTLLRFNIDILLWLLLFFLYGGVSYGRLSLVVPKFLRANYDVDKSTPEVVDGVAVTKFEKRLMGAVIAITQVLQWIFILWVCSIDNLFLDALVITTSFICHGLIINRRPHLKSIILCTLASTAMFYTAARFTIPFQYSQFFPIIIGLILVYTLYHVSYQFDLDNKKKLCEEREYIKKLSKRVDDAWNNLESLL